LFRPIRNYVRRLLKKSGWIVVHDKVWNEIFYGLPADYDQPHADTYNKVRDYTMSASTRVVSLCSAIDYLTRNQIEGDIVECGVWKGGNMMAAIDTLQKNKSFERSIHLYDTFEGMPAPGPLDVKTGGVSGLGKTAVEIYANAAPGDFVLCHSSLEEVKQNIGSLDYPADKIHFIKGMVEETIPAVMPQKIALLRLDVCLYKPVLHILTNLYPQLVSGGVLLISDYGDWKGTRNAVDEYIEKNNIRLFLSRIDSTGRIGVKA